MPIGYHCPNCEKALRTPSHLGRSWCAACEMYLIPVTIELEDLANGDETFSGKDHAYTYTTWRPKGGRYDIGETPEHRFMFTKRKDILTPHSRNVSYRASCTCGTWENRNDFTNKRAAHSQWEAHMAEVRQQLTLNVGQA